MNSEELEKMAHEADENKVWKAGEIEEGREPADGDDGKDERQETK